MPCTQLSPEMAAPIAAAYADALDNVFLYAAPVAVVGFVLALMLKQVPLRNNDVSTAADLGEGFAMPTTDSPDQLLENAVGRLIRQGSGMQLRAIAQRPGSKLDISRLWALLQVYRFGQAAGQARLGDIAEHVRVPREILEPAFDRLARHGLRRAQRRPVLAHPGGSAPGGGRPRGDDGLAHPAARPVLRPAGARPR